ncbi:hypothetical protein NQ317_011626 [Molorchus minor]|uniref:Rho-GAP domain-containing protein n=1 Tax=Molorchus minor TaxID=1323400 RepID=A0ABQ9IRU3_9CUCU|nr:hypothetical protein NQ317_011626 [Molorchus minor]
MLAVHQDVINIVQAKFLPAEVSKSKVQTLLPVIRSKEVSLHSTPVFTWLDKYSDIMNHTNRNSDFFEEQGQMGVNRESMLKYQLKLKEPDYTEKQEFTSSPGLGLAAIRIHLDLYAIGFLRNRPQQGGIPFNDTHVEAEWQKFVMEGVHPKSKYRLVALARLVGMQLAVMVNSQHYQYVKNVSYDTVGTGLLGKMGNKGGVWQVYWLGDLNYRITELTTSQVKTLLQRKELVKLLKADQLNQQKGVEMFYYFLDYTEGDINFQPTYKYDLNSDVFDTSEKARPPAWTDRILYRGKGEKCDVKLEVILETKVEKIYDILVLHLKGGKDMFITVSGDCQRSCFSTSISTLCRIPVPILQLSEEQWKSAVVYENNESAGTVQAVAESLLLFLSYTKDPVIPFELHDNCVAAASNFQNSRQIILQKVSDLHRNVFLYICMFLQELLKYSNDNGYDAKTLASLFGDILLRDPVRNSRPQASRGKSSFVYNFLVNDLSSSIIPHK